MENVKGVVMQVFGKRLREARKRAGMSQAAVAEAVREATGGSTTQGTVSRWENGIHPPTTDELSVLAGILGVDPSQLVANPPRDVDGYRAGLELAADRAEAMAKELRQLARGSTPADEVARAIDATQHLPPEKGGKKRSRG